MGAWFRAWKARRRERLLERALGREAAREERFEHETQKWQGTVSQPKTRGRKW